MLTPRHTNANFANIFYLCILLRRIPTFVCGAVMFTFFSFLIVQLYIYVIYIWHCVRNSTTGTLFYLYFSYMCKSECMRFIFANIGFVLKKYNLNKKNLNNCPLSSENTSDIIIRENIVQMSATDEQNVP